MSCFIEQGLTVWILVEKRRIKILEVKFFV